MPHLLGLDPGFAALGVARLDLVGDGEHVEALAVIRTTPSTRKAAVLATEDNVRRILELAAALEQWVTSDTLALCVEAQSWPRSASASAKVGMGWGVIGALAERHGLPVLQASPAESKRAVAGSPTASKADVQAALVARYGALPLPKARTHQEHACDALAAAVAVLSHPVVLVARRLAG